MNRKPSSRTRRREAARPRRRWPRWAPAAVVLALLALGGAALWRLGLPGRTPRPEPGAGGEPPREAHARGLMLAKASRYLESLPLLRRMAVEEPGAWRGHHDYASALLNAVHQPRHHLGLDEFAVRGSAERAAMVHEALAQLLEAERLATAQRDAQGIAWSRRTRAQAMNAWGFPWDAFVAYRQTEWVDPTWPEIAGVADRLMDQMERPLGSRLLPKEERGAP